MGEAWVIDLSGGFLALIALTGLGLLYMLVLLYMRKIRRAALLTMLGGAALIVALMKLAS